MKHIDITIDFETCALSPMAAPMSLGAVAWDRFNPDSPYIYAADGILSGLYQFYEHINLTSAFLDGFVIDARTQAWWAAQNEQAKQALLDVDAVPPRSVKQVISEFIMWVSSIVEISGAKSVCLWSQGSDFDIAILRNICDKYGLQLPVKYTNFRDHRTFLMECGRGVENIVNAECLSAQNPKHVYGNLRPMPDVMQAQPHNPIYDCLISIYSTWQLMPHTEKNI